MIPHLTIGKGPDLILGHGMAQNKELWIRNGWIKKLSEIRRVHIFDFEGHGKNNLTEEYDLTVESMAKNIISLSEILKIKKYDFMGFSMGARAGFEILKKHTMINKFISLGMHPGTPRLEKKRFEKRSIAMFNLGKRTGNKYYFQLSKILKNALLWDGVIDDINWEKTKHMIIIGEKDVNYQLTRKLLQNINGINLFILKEINHKNTFDIPDHSIDYIINFLKKGEKN